MKHIRFEINSTDEILELLDKRYDYILLHRFMPHQVISWAKADFTINDLNVRNVKARSLVMDIQTDINGARQLLGNTVHQFDIYQFEQPVPDTLLIENLPESSKLQILKQNGLKHIFDVHFEFLTISSFDEEYLEKIELHPEFYNRIIYK